ncbi:MAG: peptidyl-tRNA hydrolase [Sulfuricurvum sp. PC08-66]|nr:MAG: peptidyl-tRNA hydrolase [Sulfuricurvum sp. PC08-66]
MALIVGLGNPGSAYATTRHNIGFGVIDALLASQSPQTITKKEFQGELFKTSKHYYLKPTTYMNLSGQSVLAVKHYYKIDDVVVIHDDLDLPFGAIRFKKGGGHGGHNGLKSLDALIGSDYVRVRMGIGKPTFGSVADFVLGQFTPEQALFLPQWIALVREAIEAMDGMDWERVASRYSQKEAPQRV